MGYCYSYFDCDGSTVCLPGYRLLIITDIIGGYRLLIITDIIGGYRLLIITDIIGIPLFIWYLSTSDNMSITNRFKVTIFSLRLYSASSVKIPCSTDRFVIYLLLMLLPWNFILHRHSIYMELLIIVISVIAWELDFHQWSPLFFKMYNDLYKRSGIYPLISKCNAKSFICCRHLNCITNVNNRHFSVVNNFDLDWQSNAVIYVLTCSNAVYWTNQTDP